MTDFERFSKQIDFITEIDKLKQVLRNTILLDASRRENDVEHSWHMAMAALILMEYSNFNCLDIAKVIKMALIHDIVELDAGDVSAYSDISREVISMKEKKAADRIFNLLPPDQAKEQRSIWNEFEDGVTPEAQFVRTLDRFMPMLHDYRTKCLQWQKSGITTAGQVLERNKQMANGSEVLWNYIKNCIKDAVDKGYLKE